MLSIFELKFILFVFAMGGLEKWLSGEEQWLLYYRPGLFLTPTWRLKIQFQVTQLPLLTSMGSSTCKMHRHIQALYT